MRHELAEACPTATGLRELQPLLRRFARREMLRLGAREIGWGTTLEVAAELSWLADACLDLAVPGARRSCGRLRRAPLR